ncbi:HTH domain-containing protein, partial [Aeromonas piscicola]|uniref:helix-turn-helix transcriptional regulator n=1 Tax=Aeromonas piscicola TaxID=600645 RepID=UPI0028E99BBF
MTNLLRAHQPLTARELAERLCVSERTIYRYVDDLSLAGIPVYGEAGLGYRLSEGFELAPLQLSNAELEALITGVNLVAVLTGKGLADPARALLAKIEAALPERGPGRGQIPVVRVPDYRTARPEYVRWDKLH